MKYYKTLEIYKNSNASNIYNPNTKEAWSYEWWQYVRQYNVNGNKIIVFNNATYSNITSKHQYQTRSLMGQLGHNIDLYVDCPEGLQKGLESSVEHYFYEIDQFIEQAKKKSSRRSTNLNRVSEIQKRLNKIDYMFKYNLVNFQNNLEIQAKIYSAENFCANVINNEGKFHETI